jgi:hypothetical protein
MQSATYIKEKEKYFVPNTLSRSNSRCVTIDFRFLNIYMQVYLLEVSLLREPVDDSNGLKTDTINFSNHCCILLATPGTTCLLKALNSARSTFS